MSKLLLAYQISGETVGITTDHWNVTDLNGNDPFIYITSGDTIPDGYVDISTWYNWGRFGESAGRNYIETRESIKELLPNDLSGLTSNEIEILVRYNLYDYFKIYDRIYDGDLILSINPPIDLDYDIMGYHKQRIFDKGELIKVVYCEDYNPLTNVFSGRVVEEIRTYYRVNQMLNRREMTINWILSNDTTGHTKYTTKHYTLLEAIQAGETRRANLISDLKITVIGLLIAASGITAIQAQNAGRPFLDTYSTQISKYIQGFEDDLRGAIASDSYYSWLNMTIPNTGGITIRQYLISELTIDYTKNNIYV